MCVWGDKGQDRERQREKFKYEHSLKKHQGVRRENGEGVRSKDTWNMKMKKRWEGIYRMQSGVIGE